MYILLTDILTCPRCGPEFGLILLADRITQERRVLDGVLGCANCREKYPISNGRIDFIGAGVGDDTHGPASAEEDAVRLAALMGVTEGPGYVVLAGDAARHAAAVAGLLDGVEVIAAFAGTAAHGAMPHVNPMSVAAALPIANARVTGVVLSGSAADALLEEGARVISPFGRLVLEGAPADAGDRLRAAGLRVLLQQDSTVIAGRQ